MKRLLSHLNGSELFVAFTALAALTHSTWSLAVVFGGLEPDFGLSWIGWIIPGFFIALSIDVGLLVTSMQLRSGSRTWQRYIAFVVLALSMFSLQLYYSITHAPLVPLSAGVRIDWIPFLSLFRDAMIWIVPLLLPIAITLHSFSGNDRPEPMPSSSTALALVAQDGPERVVIEKPEHFEVECQYPECAWSGVYENPASAKAALTAHQRAHKVKVS